nr:beta galactosidase jelly roll domain-containing protein [uncultured Victivallis sp.]
MYRTTRRRAFFLASRLLHNLGAQSTSGLLEKFRGKTNHQEGVIDLSSGWLGKADPKQIGRRENWQSPDYKPGPEWRGIEVPGMFDLQFEDLHGYDGHFWYRKTFDLESELPANTECKLYFGGIDDESWIWLNGEFLGEVTMKSNPNDFWAADRIYTLKTDKIKPKGNLLVVLVNDRQQNGGILGKPNLNCLPAYRLYVDQPIAEDDPYRYYRW